MKTNGLLRIVVLFFFILFIISKVLINKSDNMLQLFSEK